MKKVCLVHSGGTIGMVQTPNGFAPSPGLVESELGRLLVAKEGAISCDVIQADPLIDSGLAKPDDWNWIGAQIADRYDEYDSFLVTHGTDSLAFTAAALSFALEGLQKPVILTGSMLPLSVSGSDGPLNLSDALQAAADTGPGVWVQFAGKLMPAARVQKAHSTAIDAFAAPADARVSLRLGQTFRHHIVRAGPVAIVTIAPGYQGAMLSAVLDCADGVVLRAYGSGTVPNGNEFREALFVAREKSIPVVAVSQCMQGGVSIGTYEAGALLRDAEVLDGRDMTTEAAYAKLLFALSAHREFDAQRRFMETQICGEWS